VLVNATAYPTGGGGGGGDAGGESGLPSGATAGIAVGATVAGLALLSLIVWFVMARRRRRRKLSRLQHETGPDGAALGDGALGAAGAAPAVYSPSGQPDMSHLSSPAGGAPSRQDYFGPDATPGPFTQQQDEGAAAAVDAAIRGAVPVNPRSPADIIVPVEIDASGVPRPENKPSTPEPRSPAGSGVLPVPAPGPIQDSIDGRVELP
jgi:hypothetical protein